jgi:hypothetical protein
VSALVKRLATLERIVSDPTMFRARELPPGPVLTGIVTCPGRDAEGQPCLRPYDLQIDCKVGKSPRASIICQSCGTEIRVDLLGYRPTPAPES